MTITKEDLLAEEVQKWADEQCRTESDRDAVCLLTEECQEVLESTSGEWDHAKWRPELWMRVSKLAAAARVLGLVFSECDALVGQAYNRDLQLLGVQRRSSRLMMKSDLLTCTSCGKQFPETQPGRVTPVPDETHCSWGCASEEGWYYTPPDPAA